MSLASGAGDMNGMLDFALKRELSAVLLHRTSAWQEAGVSVSPVDANFRPNLNPI
jgi:hypothetical protein